LYRNSQREAKVVTGDALLVNAAAVDPAELLEQLVREHLSPQQKVKPARLKANSVPLVGSKTATDLPD
jgi:hypothetical protein